MKRRAPCYPCRTLALALATAALLAVVSLLQGCADPYRAPPVTPTTVILQIVPPAELPADCGHPNETHIAGCYRAPQLLGAGGVVTMPVPRAGDYAWLAVIEHELAHADGWRHPAWRDGIE